MRNLYQRADQRCRRELGAPLTVYLTGCALALAVLIPLIIITAKA